MADLQKLFVLVSAANTAAFKSTYVAGGESRNTAYDNKIVFLEGTGEIFTKGKLYGMSNDQAAQLSKAIAAVGLNADGTLPSWGAGADSIKGAASIIAAVVALDAKAKSLQTELDAEQKKVADSKTLDENYEFTGEIKYVAAAGDVPAHIALCDEAGAELSTVAVSDIIGNGVLKSSSYNKETGELSLTFAQADGTTKVEKINLADMLDINDVQIAAGSQAYMGVDLTGGENSQAIFSIKVSKMADATLTGLADAKDVKTYVDKQVADKNVSAEGDTYVSATAADNKVTVKAQIGNMTFTPASGSDAAKLEGVANKLVDSAQAAGAIKSYADAVVAKEAADRATAITTAIEALDVPAQTKGTNVHVTVSEADGKVALDSVVEDYATVSRTATTSTADAPKTDAAISISSADEGKLIKASDLKAVAGYAADKVAEETHRVDAKIAALAGDEEGAAAGVSTRVTTAAGKVSGVVVAVADNAVAAGGAKDARTLTVANEANVIKGQAIVEIKKYVDNVVGDNTADLAVSAAGDDYITAAVDGQNNKKINVSADVTTLTVTTSAGVDSTLAGTAKSLVDAADVATKVSSFVNARISEEIKKLDVEEKTIGDSNVIIKYSETDGKVAASAEIKYATVAYGKVGEAAATLTVTNGDQLVKGNDIDSLKQYVDSHVAEAVAALDSSVVEKDVSNFVTVTTAIADGKLNADASSVAVVYAAHTAGQYSNGVASGAFVNEVLGDLWETYTA